VAVVPAGFGWEDIGDFAALADLVPGSGLKVLGDADRVLALGSSGLVVPEGGRTVAVLGLEDVVVVDTGDALLVTTSAHAQDVKSIVEALKASGRGDLT
jgi:mannose-1-phosphate guanylyltransferase